MRVLPIDRFSENVEQMLSEGKSVELRGHGRSMQPYLRGDGSEIIVASPFSPEELVPGAIVLFRHNGKYVCHRIIRRKDDELLMQGDGVIAKREQASVSDVIGIIRTLIRQNGEPVSTRTKAAQRYWHCWFRLSPIRKYLLRLYRIIFRV